MTIVVEQKEEMPAEEPKEDKEDKEAAPKKLRAPKLVEVWFET